MQFGPVWPMHKGLSQTCDRLLRVPGAHVNDAEKMQRLRLVGLKDEHLLQLPGSLGKPTSLQMLNSLLQKGAHRCRIGRIAVGTGRLSKTPGALHRDVLIRHAPTRVSCGPGCDRESAGTPSATIVLCTSAMPMPLITLVRHGQTAHSLARRFSGHNAEPLSAVGINNVRALRHWCSTQIPSPGVICTSALLRAQQTADLLGYSPKLRLVDPRLNESDFGAWEGLTGDEISARYPAEFAQWIADPTGFTPPGGESVQALASRVLECYRELCAHYSDEALMLVCHGGAIRAIVLAELGLGLDRFWQLNPPWASATGLEPSAGHSRLLFFGQRG